jgi:hypothetical protein
MVIPCAFHICKAGSIPELCKYLIIILATWIACQKNASSLALSNTVSFKALSSFRYLVQPNKFLRCYIYYNFANGFHWTKQWTGKLSTRKLRTALKKQHIPICRVCRHINELHGIRTSCMKLCYQTHKPRFFEVYKNPGQSRFTASFNFHHAHKYLKYFTFTQACSARIRYFLKFDSRSLVSVDVLINLYLQWELAY